MLFVVARARRCRSSKGNVCVIFTRVGVSGPHLSEGENLTPKRDPPEVPEEYLEHCSHALSSPPSSSILPPASYSARSVLHVLLGAAGQ